LRLQLPMHPKAKLILIGCLSLVVFSTSAQYLSNDGRFQVNERKGCAAFEFTFTNLEAGECNSTRPCAIGYFLNGSSELVEINANIITGTAQVNLTQPGSYDFITNYGGQLIDRISIEVRANNSPDFQVVACSNNDVRLQVTENIYEQYVINFGDGSADRIINNIAPTVQHDYTSQGNFTINVRGRDLNADDNCATETKQFTTFTTLPVTNIDRLVVQNTGNISLEFNTQIGLQYRLQIAVNSNLNFQTLQNILGDGDPRNINVPNLNTENNFYCFRLGSFDPCTNTTTFGQVICSMQFNLQIDNAVNRLSWNIQQGNINNYNIRRDNQAYLNNWPNTSFNDIDANDDDDVVCNTQYCYQIVANYNNGSTSTSVIRCGTSFKIFTPPSINNLSASNDGNAIQISWQAPQNINIPFYEISKSVNGGNFQFLEERVTNSFVDNTAPGENRFCYKVDYIEQCGNLSDSGIEACVIHLEGNMSNDNIATLEWTPYTGWINGVSEYRITKFGTDGGVIRTFTVNAGTSFTDTSVDPFAQRVRYIVTAIPNTQGLPTVRSNEITLLKTPNIFYPSAFTPNNDNLNDEFKVIGQFVSAFRMKIFNRWGELVFTSNNINQGWDGNYRGKAQPEGTYAFVCELTDEDGGNYTREGSVVLLRKD
jgi:gliding motility-associated-like protein